MLDGRGDRPHSATPPAENPLRAAFAILLFPVRAADRAVFATTSGCACLPSISAAEMESNCKR